MQQWIAAALIAMLFTPARAQFFDDFSDGELLTNPAWFGDLSHFTINAGQLQLSAPVAGVSQLWSVVAFPDSVRWSLDYKMDFAPSTANKLRCYLMLDTTDLAAASGYFLELGENGSNDALQFYVLENGAPVLLGTSEGILGTDPSEGRITVSRDASGGWTVQAKMTSSATTVFSLEDSAVLPGQAAYFGLECIYSETRRDKFFFDNIRIEEIVPDTIPPVLLSAAPIDGSRLRLTFSEPLAAASINPSGITVSDGVGAAQTASLTSEMEVQATFSQPFVNGVLYTVQVTPVRDLAGNLSSTQSTDFSYVEIAMPGRFDIQINELLPDPTPSVGLPEAEFIELYNPSTRAYDLGGVTLLVGATTVSLPEHILDPGAFVIITDTDDVPAFEPYGSTLGVNLPALTNTGSTIELALNGTVIHSVQYEDSWYQDPDKDDGGWTLELINERTPCRTAENWRASVNLTGGTPGAVNSVADTSFSDENGPALVSLFPDPSGLEIVLTFDELLSDLNPDVSLDPAIPINAISIDENRMTIILSEPMTPSTMYQLTVTGLQDCLGNSAPTFDQSFALPTTPEPGDLLINELLFDPATGGAPFIELYNTSSRFLSTADINIAEIQGSQVDLAPVEADFLIFPNTIVVLTPNPDDLTTRYPTHDAAVMVATGLPSFDRDRGEAAVLDRFGNTLDAFAYSSDLHNPLLDHTKGVSLERVSLLAPAADEGNWHSAAEGAGFATPGLPNSQAIVPGDPGNLYTITNRTFSPDGDGFADLLLVQFNQPPAGSLASVTVFDAQGREIERLLRTALVGVGSVAQWDGTTFEDLLAAAGIYILRIEIFDPSGATRVFKEGVVLATRL